MFYPIKSAPLDETDINTVGIDLLPCDASNAGNLTPNFVECEQLPPQESSSMREFGSFVFKWAAYTGSAALVGFYAGPYMAVATRQAFPVVHTLVTGTAVPSQLSYAYWFVYVPAREHACGYAYANAPGIVSGAATALNFLYDGAKVVGQTASSVVKQVTTNLVNQYFSFFSDADTEVQATTDSNHDEQPALEEEEYSSPENRK